MAAHYDVRVAEMFSARRARNIARPRQVAMYLAKTLTSLSYPEIGRQFGGRDHTTVMHAVRSIEGLIATDNGISRGCPAAALAALKLTSETSINSMCTKKRPLAGRPGCPDQYFDVCFNLSCYILWVTVVWVPAPSRRLRSGRDSAGQ